MLSQWQGIPCWVQVTGPKIGGARGEGQIYFYVPASYILYLSDFCRFLLCTCGWERRWERGAGEGEGARERGIECVPLVQVVC